MEKPITNTPIVAEITISQVKAISLHGLKHDNAGEEA